ncbi:hypothetical protein HRbin39_00144 [bacterium HR39]|nr:hypothetical protein HRbin39_00144 [bacterium HR39]
MIATLVVPVFLDQLAFLRVLRAVRLLHSRIVLRRLGRLFPRLRHRRSSVQAAVDLVAFVTSALVHVRQHPVNPRIATMADAVPFTVTAFTTSGFGDVVPVGTAGRVLAVAITIVGISLLIRCAVSAPIDGRGTVVWSCFPRFDGDPVFCHLVDEGGERGLFAVDFPDLQNVEQRHLPHTAVLETVLRDGMDPAALEDITAQDPGVPVVSRFAGCARHLEGCSPSIPTTSARWPKSCTGRSPCRSPGGSPCGSGPWPRRNATTSTAGAASSSASWPARIPRRSSARRRPSTRTARSEPADGLRAGRPLTPGLRTAARRG